MIQLMTRNMENDDKPFVCTAPKCGQRFTNSDHLSVHQQKHQLSLNIGLRQGDSLVDQTPTPTRFLAKTPGEGGELFEGLPESNPFDQDFKKATALTTPTSIPSSVNLSVPVISISTPEQTGDTSKASSVNTVQLLSSSSENRARVKHTPVTNIKIIDSSSAFAKRLNEGAPGSVTFVVNTQKSFPTVTANPQVGSKRTATVLIAGQGNIPGNIPAIIIDQNRVQQSIEGMPTLGVKPESKTTLARSAVPHPAIVTPRSFQNGISDSNKSTLAKQKLKEILQQNASPTSFINPQSPANSISQNMNQSYAISYTSTPSPSNSMKSDNSDMMDDFDEDFKGDPIKRSRRSQDETDPDERRRRFLERNRAAASRCRQKRKVWVQQLEKKADDLSSTNSTLQNEINILRREVAQLKGLLLAHKDCPVTVQQQKIVNHSNQSYQGRTENIMVTKIKQRMEAEEVASSALTDMANQAQIVEPRNNNNNNNNGISCVSVISGVPSPQMDTTG